jgi:hypothetical protein
VKDLTILMDTKQGRPAEMLEDLVGRHVRIVAACLFPRLGGRVAHVAVDEPDVETVREVVTAHGGTVADERDCIVVPPGRPGGAPAAARTVADAGITAFVVYFGGEGEMVLSTNDPQATAQVLGLA